MAKVIDITEKLNFEQPPVLKIKDTELVVNDDAATMLKIMGILSGKEAGPKEIMEIYAYIFSEKDREKIESMKLSFDDFTTVINEAVNLIAGDSTPGEQ